jgi:murein DD-endopeptidase MepM/ murein hydrolase activator NlpD
MNNFIYPLPPKFITQRFGENANYYKQYGQIGHNGIDIGADMGAPIRAAADGTVVFAGAGRTYADGFASWMGDIAGNCIILDHGSVYTSYSHLESFAVGVGKKVKQGDIIGYVGTTGASTGPHLHWDFIGKTPDFGNGYAGRLNPSQFKITENNMPEPLSLTGARALAFLIGNWKLTTGQSALQGGLDDRLQEHWVGKGLTNEFIVSLLEKDTTKKHLASVKNAFDELERLQGVEGLSPEDKKKIKAAIDALNKVVDIS